MLVAPIIGELAAVALEIPVLLLACVVLARRLVRRCQIAGWRSCATMGATSLAVLFACELGLAVIIGRTLAEWQASLATPAGALGLTGQLAFGLLPLAYAPASRFNS